jgi:hypothetical protein
MNIDLKSRGFLIVKKNVGEIIMEMKKIWCTKLNFQILNHLETPLHQTVEIVDSGMKYPIFPTLINSVVWLKIQMV